MTTTSPAADVLLDEEELYRELVRAAEAGELSPSGWDAVEYLASQLPDGYELDEHNHVVRTDPTLPDHFYIPALVNGVPSGTCRVPVSR